MCFNFAAVQDNFGRLHDRSKDTPKTMKQLTRLFPNKVTIQMPQVLNLLILHPLIVKVFFYLCWCHVYKCFSCLIIGEVFEVCTFILELWQDENLLSDWKLQLDRDVETLKSQSNIISIRSVSIFRGGHFFPI